MPSAHPYLLAWLPGLAEHPAWTGWALLALADLAGTLAWMLVTAGASHLMHRPPATREGPEGPHGPPDPAPTCHDHEPQARC